MTTPSPQPLGRRSRFALIGACAGIAALFILANVHLVAVSLASDPGCVPHLRAPDPGGGFRAAKSAC
jgi:hypothetical protein